MYQFRVLTKRIISFVVAAALIIFLSPVLAREAQTIDTLQKKIETLEKDL